VHIPLIAEADAVLAALQGELTGVSFRGTLRHPAQEIRQVTLTQLGTELRNLLLGDVRSAQTGQ
jgi:hypothetical protein